MIDNYKQKNAGKVAPELKSRGSIPIESDGTESESGSESESESDEEQHNRLLKSVQNFSQSEESQNASLLSTKGQSFRTSQTAPESAFSSFLQSAQSENASNGVTYDLLLNALGNAKGLTSVKKKVSELKWLTSSVTCILRYRN